MAGRRVLGLLILIVVIVAAILLIWYIGGQKTVSGLAVPY